MPHRLPVFILAGVIAIFASGCNSHATFPENNGNNANNANNQNCSNGVLDPGEPCDLDFDLNPKFQPDDSCVNRGYAGGSLVCDSSSCQVITSNCIPLEGCNPVYDFGCDLGTNCFYFPESGQASCHEPQFAAEGAPCTWPPDCSPLHTCHEGTCRRVCAPGSACPNEVDTCIGMGWYEGDLGVCPLATGPCDPVNDSGCSEGNACYFNGDALGGTCMTEGSAYPGDTCWADNQCRPGLACLRLFDSEDGRCTELCDDENPCPAGTLWCAYFPGGRAGFCTENVGCDPINGTNGCPADQYCMVTNPAGSFTCLYPGPVTEGAPCDLFNRCDQGLYCAVDYDHKCHRLCMDNGYCTQPEECFAMFWMAQPWTEISGWLGYCRQP